MEQKSKAVKAETTKKNFVKVTVVKSAGSVMQCSGGPLCNESK